MNFTINQLNAEMQAIQQSHLQLNSYHWGNFIDAYKSRSLNWPLLCSYYVNGGGASPMLVPINLIIIVADKTYKDNSNLNEIESDTLQVCKDILNVIANSHRWKSFSRFNSYTIDKFIQDTADEVAGHILRVNISLKDSKSVCGLPMVGYDFEQTYGVSCAPALITNSDGSVSFSMASGGTFNAPDQQLNINVNGVPITPEQLIAFKNHTINITGTDVEVSFTTP